MSEALTNRQAVRGTLRRDVPLAGLTAWGVGGIAERVYEPADLEDLSRFLAALPGAEPLTWVGLGSNILVRDGGVRGTVILTAKGLGLLERVGPRSVKAQCGVPSAKLARFCAREGLVGGEFWAGIPGTVGGSLAMNAGAYGAATWDFVVSVETVDRNGCRQQRTPDEFEVSYRRVTGSEHEWFASATFELAEGHPEEARARIRELLRKRADDQPTGQRSCGSVFKNPPGDFAGRLVEQAGLKGLRIGGALISEKHGNFIVNDGTACAADVEALIDHIKQAVREARAVELEAEVRIIGQPLRGGKEA